MKTALFATLFALSATSAQAAPLFCHTLPSSPAASRFVLTVNSMSNSRTVTIDRALQGITSRYLLQLSPVSAQVVSHGPENFSYVNPAAGFELEVSFVSFGHTFEFPGRVTMEANGARVSEPVRCIMAMDHGFGFRR